MKYPLKKVRQQQRYDDIESWNMLIGCWKKADSLHEFLINANMTVPNAKKFDILMFRLYYIKIEHPFLYWMIDVLFAVSLYAIAIPLVCVNIFPSIVLCFILIVVMSFAALWHAIILDSPFAAIQRSESTY